MGHKGLLLEARVRLVDAATKFLCESEEWRGRKARMEAPYTDRLMWAEWCDVIAEELLKSRKKIIATVEKIDEALR